MLVRSNTITIAFGFILDSPFFSSIIIFRRSLINTYAEILNIPKHAIVQENTNTHENHFLCLNRFSGNNLMVRLLSRSVRKTMIIQSPTRISGLVLTFLGSSFIIAVLSYAWASGVSFLNLSAFNEFLWTNRLNTGFGIQFELIYLIIAGAVTILLGVSLLARRTERIEEVTVITDDVTTTLECTVCGYQWKEIFSQTQLESMGFPRNRTISRRKCPVCGRFTRPKIVEVRAPRTF